jgi:membrane protease YdiL (CAAX protease family)
VLPALVSPLVSSALFGVWHVLPTARTLEVNGLPPSPAVILGAVAATAVVRAVLRQLRQATGGIVAPALVHVAANGGATVAAYAVFRSPYAGPAPAAAAVVG